jgi:hypothetical protein
MDKIISGFIAHRKIVNMDALAVLHNSAGRAFADPERDFPRDIESAVTDTLEFFRFSSST